MTQAVILIGHGSLRSASGASMIRLAARLRENRVASLVEPAFLNFSRPTLAEAVERCQAAGAQALTIQPYFLIEGAYVRHDLRRLIAETLRELPPMPVRVAPAFGGHPSLVDLALQRIYAAAPVLAPGASPNDGDRSNEQIDEQEGAPGDWGLLLMAHGTPLAAANAPLYEILDALRYATGVTHARVAFLDCNEPDIPTGIQELVSAGATRLVTLPYFLHMGRHVREDLPDLLTTAGAELPHVPIFQAQHLNYDLRLVQVITDRLGEATEWAALEDRVTG